MATVFLVAGANELLIPREKLAKAPGGDGSWISAPGVVKALGAVEILGAVGLILPALLDIAPVLVPLAALGLGLIMIGAAIVEFRRQEFKHVLLNLAYLALLAFVAWGRFGPGPSLADRVWWLLDAESESPEQQRNVNIRRISTAVSRCGEHFLITPPRQCHHHREEVEEGRERTTRATKRERRPRRNRDLLCHNVYR
jgi:DoxX-like family